MKIEFWMIDYGGEISEKQSLLRVGRRFLQSRISTPYFALKSWIPAFNNNNKPLFAWL